MGISLIAFDMYGTLLEIASLEEIVREYTPMAEALVEAWRARQLQLANLATTTGRYVDFDRLTLMALHEIAPRYHLKLTAADQKRLLDGWAQMRPYTDVQFAVEAARRRGYQAVVLTNAVESTARNALEFAQLSRSFDGVLSADEAQVYKPNAAVYGLLEKHYRIPASDTAFVSAADWDASGARQAGLRAIWVRRSRMGAARPERSIDDLSGLDAALDEMASADA